MTKLTVVLTVIVTSILVEKVTTAQYFDVQTFLKSLQQQLNEEQRQIKQKQSHIYKNDDDDNYYGSLDNKDIDQNSRLTYKKSKDKRNSQKQVSRVSFEDLEEYVNNRRPFTLGQKLVPSDLLDLNEVDNQLQYKKSHSLDYPGQRHVDSPSEYSKVYVVLNSEAIKRSKNKDKLNALLSSLLASPPGRERRDRNRYSQDQYEHHHDQRDSYRDNRHRNQQQNERYKGFHLSNDFVQRRSNIDSNEMENEPRPPRPRESRGGGGGGGGGRGSGGSRGRERGGGGGNGGRTAIPYIRHRGGDIYERD